MPDHTSPEEPGVLTAEPAGITEVVRLVVAALVALGVFEADDATVNAIILAVGGLISIGLTFFTRRRSTPLAKPRAEDGTPLVPVPPEKTFGDPPSQQT